MSQPLHFTALSVSDGAACEELFAIKNLWQGDDSDLPSEVLVTFRTYPEVEAFCAAQHVSPVLDEAAQALREELEDAAGNEDGD